MQHFPRETLPEGRVFLAKIQRLARASTLVNSSLEFDAVVRDALDLAMELSGAERGFLMLREHRLVVATRDFSGIDPSESTEAPVQTIVARVFETREPFFSGAAAAAEARDPASPIVALHSRSIACVPLCVRDETIAVIYLEARMIPGIFRPADRELLILFGQQAALAIGTARQFEFQDRLLETIANGVITLDGARHVTSFNRAAETTFGVTAREMRRAGITALAARIPDFRDLLETFYSSGGVLLRAEVDASRFDGTALTMQLRFTPLEGPEGKGVAIVVTDVTEQRRLEEAHAAELAHKQAVQVSFSRYLAPHVVQSLVDDPQAVRLGGERCRATMVFADIRGFTSLAATLEPERVSEILNAYFEEAVRIVFEHDGLLDKFYGDGVMAVFGPPRPRADDAQRAVAAALRLRDVVDNELAKRLAYPLAISIGLASGEVVAGHFGSQLRMDYTVIGDAVNLAQGLQSASPAGGLYLDEATYLAARPEGKFHRIAARVKGRGELVPVYALLPETTLDELKTS
jgi:adenylate cyclase